MSQQDVTVTPVRVYTQVGTDRDSAPWRESALCAQTDPEVFFPPVGSSGEMARRICRQCPVTAECLEVALSRPAHSDEGIWGGTTPKERRAIRAERGAA